MNFNMACVIDKGFYFNGCGDICYLCPNCDKDKYDLERYYTKLCKGCLRDKKLNEILK